MAESGPDALVYQTRLIAKSFKLFNQEQVLDSFKTTFSDPQSDVAAMNSSLNVLLKSIFLASENKYRGIMKKWIGHGLVGDSCYLSLRTRTSYC